MARDILAGAFRTRGENPAGTIGGVTADSAIAPARHADEPVLREVIEALAPILRAAGCETAIEPTTYRDGYARLMGELAVASAVAGTTALVAGRHRLAALAGAA